MALSKRINPNTDALPGVSELNYKFACRCCLKSDAEFVKLESVSVARSLDPASEDDKVSLLRCLLYCVRAENAPELPQYICIECSKSLQVAYYFLQNAVRAHEILCRKLCPGKAWSTEGKRLNGAMGQRFQPSPSPKETATSLGDRTRPPKSMRQECQVCGEIFHSRMELKQHLRQHTDGISYQCKMCNFTTLKQRQLLDHYRCDHSMTPNQAEEHVKASPLPKSPIKEDEVKAVCTLEDMELLIPTVLTPEDYVQPTIDSEQLRDLEQQLAVSMGDAVTEVDSLTSTLPPMDTAHNVSIGTEYLVLPDGSLQQVNGGGVVIEYIDDSKPQQQPPPPPPPPPQHTPHINISLQNLLGPDENDAMDIDVNELIVEDMMTINKPTISTVLPNPAKPRPTVGVSQNFKHKCSICPRTFSSVPRLKSHQLTHSNLPKFFCDQCDFYSLRSVDLIEHYKTTHHRVDENGGTSQEPAQGSEETGVYSCDMCLFETRTCSQLRTHYTEQHEIQPTEVQLRPSWTNNGGNGTNNKEPPLSGRPEPADLPVAIKYPPLNADAQVPVQLQQQVQVQQQVQMQPQQVVVTTPTTLITQTSNHINVVVDTTPLFYASTTSSAVQAVPMPVQTMPGPVQAMPDPVQAMSDPVQAMSDPVQALPVQNTPVSVQVMPVMQPASENNSNAFEIQNPFPKIQPSNEQTEEPVTVEPISTANTSNISMFGDMQDFIDNTDVAAICTIPADDMPVVDGDDIVIDNNNISLDFDAENLFEEFEEEDETVGEDEGEEEEEEEEEDEADNDDENDNNEAATDQNLLLTSDDDDVDDFDDEQSKHLQKPYCIYCNKKFTSQYKFENHMFVHRGLAPYRCELCTNLYNMKRLLIRHYKTVHKRMPTRDMVQAKGDKVLVERSNIEKLYLDGIKTPMVMCAKCPYECEADGEMRKHLNAHHGINDGMSTHANEVFMIRKLPFECPRCIRSFAAKGTLTRHLQRSHLVDTIIEMQTTLSSAATTTITTTTATIAGPAGDKEPFKDEMMTTTSTAAAGNELGVNQDDGTAATAVRRGRAVPEEDVDPVTLDAATAATTAAIAAAISSASASPSASTTALAPSASHLYPTPTPFDFDYDLMGSDAQRSQVSTPTSNPNLGSPGSGLLNGSDKLLTTAAMTPFPSKDLRSNRRQPHSSIYVCKLCNKSFDELGKLVKHEMEMHSNTEPSRWGYQHKCSICSTSYRTLTLLKFHMKRHINRNSQCKLCPKSYATSAELERHMKIKHCREKLIGPCGLDGCGKMFAFKHHMVRHQNASHLKSTNRHICETCNKELVNAADLRSHMIMHKNMLTFRCPECDRKYLRRGRLLSHLLKIHKKRLNEEETAVLFSGNKEDPSPPQSPTQSPPQSPNNLKIMTRKGQLGFRKNFDVNETVTNEETHPDVEPAAAAGLSK